MNDIAQQMGRLWRRLNLIPSTLFQPGFLLPDAPRFVVEELPLSMAATNALADLAKRHASIDIHLGQRLGLQRTVRLPKAAVAKAEAAINIQMRQSLPEMAKGLVWQTEEVQRTADEVVFTVNVVKDAVLQYLAQQVRQAGSSLHEIRFSGVRGAPLFSADRNTSKMQRVWIAATFAGVASVALWSIWSIESEVRLLQPSNAARTTTNAALEDRLVDLTTKLKDIEGERARLLDDQHAFELRSARLPFWTDLTRILPDTVWISEMNIDAASVTLSGFTTGDATEVVETLQDVDWVDSVRLEGPIQFDSYSKQNRFVVVAQLKTSSSAP